MPEPNQENGRRYTYADYLTWGEQDRSEIIDGIRYVDGQRCEFYDGELTMLAKPSIAHQRISRNILTQMHSYLEGKRCEVFSEIDVLLPLQGEESAEETSNLFSPDITLVCDKSKLGENYCFGAPDMVVEILSKSTMRNDRILKYNKYQQAGIKEYWIVDPASKTVQVFLLGDGYYHPIELYGETDLAKVNALEGCYIELARVFSE